MALPTFVASGTATSNSTSQVLPDWPAGLAAGDLVLLPVAYKYSDRTIAVPSPAGFTKLISVAGGAGTDGTADEGLVGLDLWKYEAVGGESGTIQVDASGSTASCLFGRTHALRKTGGTTWGISTAYSGSDNAAGTAFSVTFSGDPGMTTDDLICIAWAVNTDAFTVSLHGLSEGGVSIGTVSSRGNAAVTAGASMRVGFVTAPITAGTSGGAATYTHTESSSAANAPAGAAIIVRLREISGGGGGGAIAVISAHHHLHSLTR